MYHSPEVVRHLISLAVTGGNVISPSFYCLIIRLPCQSSPGREIILADYFPCSMAATTNNAVHVAQQDLTSALDFISLFTKAFN